MVGSLRSAGSKESASVQTAAGKSKELQEGPLQALKSFLRHGAGRLKGGSSRKRSSVSESVGAFFRGGHSDVRQKRILRLVHHALASEDYSGVLALPDDEACIAADVLQKMLENSSSDSLSAAETPISFPRTYIRQLILELALKRGQVPVSLFVKDVKVLDNESRAAGGFADIYYGTYKGQPVALKCLRIYLMCPENHKKRLTQAFYRESILWNSLHHEHILSFIGVSEDVFQPTLCMVLPWMEKGSIRHHLHNLKAGDNMTELAMTSMLNKWLHEIALGLSYLHGEDVIHGDLRGANILIDHDDHIRLADFGLSVITHCASSAGDSLILTHGGSVRWQAPELLDPEKFGSMQRPTFASDIYAFGIVCIELYTCQVPYAGFQDQQVYIRVLRGNRPGRPGTGDETVMCDALWDLVSRCWAPIPDSRPSSDDTTHAILRIIEQIESSPQPGTASFATEDEDDWPNYPYSPSGIPIALSLKGVQRLSDTPATGSETSDVFLGRYQNSRVALKRFRLLMSSESEQRLQRVFYREALKWKNIQHRNVLPFLGLDFSDFTRTWCVVTPWMMHGNIRSFIERLKSSDLFEINSLRLNKWLFQVAKGLAYLHAHGLVHGNLWGRNIMVDSDWTVRIADYGQAFMQNAEAASVSSTGGFSSSGYSTGTHDTMNERAHRWMAPELLDPGSTDEIPTYASDVYSFGCVCVELYDCQNPFKHIRSDAGFFTKILADKITPKRPDRSRGAIDDMPRELWDLLRPCWLTEPSDRPTSQKIAQTFIQFIANPLMYTNE